MNRRRAILSSSLAAHINGGFFLAALVLWVWLPHASAGNVELGLPLVFSPSQPPMATPDWERTMEVARLDASGQLTVNPGNRAASRAFFNAYYLAQDAPINWTGNRSTCNAGDTNLSFRDAVLLRINYFRAMAGVPATVTFSDTYNAMDQQAALMMSVNGQLSHNPPTTWTCYNAVGAQAANSSNLSMGIFGRDAIDLYMNDPGIDSVGHRRWILYPQTQVMGTGDLPRSGGQGSNALWVIDSSHYGDPRPPTREEFVAWPPPGYVPYQVVFASWSFSYAGADFSSATVTMTKGGASVPVASGTLANGYGENTIVWIPSGQSWSKPANDTSYLVTVNGVLIAGNPHSFTYTVNVFDPATLHEGIAAIMLLLD